MMIATTKRSTDPEQGKVFLVKNLSVEGLVAILGVIGSAIYTVAFLSADVRENSKDISSVKEWVAHHAANDDAKNDKLNEKLDAIKEELDKLVGRVDGQRRGS